MSTTDLLAVWRANPFFVLELTPNASRADVERAGQRLLALLSINAQGAGDYVTPLGPAKRDADMVRQALSILRDPAQRLVHELWADIGSVQQPVEPSLLAQHLPPTWEHAECALGWKKQ